MYCTIIILQCFVIRDKVKQVAKLASPSTMREPVCSPWNFRSGGRSVSFCYGLCVMIHYSPSTPACQIWNKLAHIHSLQRASKQTGPTGILLDSTWTEKPRSHDQSRAKTRVHLWVAFERCRQLGAQQWFQGGCHLSWFMLYKQSMNCKQIHSMINWQCRIACRLSEIESFCLSQNMMLCLARLALGNQPGLWVWWGGGGWRKQKNRFLDFSTHCNCSVSILTIEPLRCHHICTFNGFFISIRGLLQALTC